MYVHNIYRHKYISVNKPYIHIHLPAHTLIYRSRNCIRSLAYSSLTKLSKQLLHMWRTDLPDTENTTEFESSTSSSSFSLKKGIYE